MTSEGNAAGTVAGSPRGMEEPPMNEPVVVRDARFRAGRALVSRGKAEAASALFSNLVAEAREKFGPSHIETAPAYYEYGNALLRGLLQQRNEEEGKELDDKSSKTSSSARESAAAAAERRLVAQVVEEHKSNESTDDKNTVEEIDTNKQISEQDTDDKGLSNNESSDQEENNVEQDVSEGDWQLALEMMETAWSILDEYLEPNEADNGEIHEICSDITGSPTASTYRQWASEQFPRYLTGIGDILSAMNRHADAADAYLRSFNYRTEILGKDKDAKSLSSLENRRRAVEACILLAEELLQCPPNRDVITTESEEVIAKAEERINVTRTFYNQARDQLQDAVLLMAELASQGHNVDSEKESICYVSTLVMGVGMMLAANDENADGKSESEPVSKKAKH
jgi:hypothetical protein